MAFLDPIKDILNEARGETRPAKPGGTSGFDPDSLQDPIARQTDWTPLAGGGANFRTTRLVHAGPSRIEFRASVQIQLFGLAFFVIGLLTTLVIAATRWNELPTLQRWILIGTSTVFDLIGIGIILFARRPTVFDRGLGWFWKRWKPPAWNEADPRRAVRLDQIHALQLLRERVTGKQTYWSYELNLVLRDGRRTNVTDHGDLKTLRRDATTLARFLGRPLWDATAPRVDDEKDRAF